MAGWNLKIGVLDKSKIDEKQIWGLFNAFFSRGTTMKNLYKINLVRSLILIADKNMNGRNIFFDLTNEFGKIFWNLKRELNLNITIFNGVSIKSHQEKSIEEIYIENLHTKLVFFDHLDNDIKKKYFLKTKKTLKTNVIGAVYNDFKKKIFSFDLKCEELIMNEDFLNFFIKNREILIQLLQYREIEFLKLTESNGLKIQKYIEEKLTLDKYSENFFDLINEEINKKTGER
ncbi:MAG: hypothetical protein KA384_05045 [Leptotrichiaceae bacterium]|nr:hypothetical protein [Leptotrichiaceae bacterium]